MVFFVDDFDVRFLTEEGDALVVRPATTYGQMWEVLCADF